jgi:hypothetical protein
LNSCSFMARLPSMHHPLEACYDLVVYETQLS